MPAARSNRLVRQLRATLGTAVTLTEAELWERYVRDRDEVAFEMLVRRHGPMVLGVCRRILRNQQDAEDAFQATFLVFVRRAASLRSPRAIANWLHGVARRTALEARSAAIKRQAKEARAILRISTCEEPDDLRSALDHELGQIAEKYRIAIVLCDLEGLTRKEAAQRLGLAEGTVASRLARGRDMLAKRLVRRGLAGSVLALALANGEISAGLPSPLVHSTIAATFGSSSGIPASGNLFSANVVAISEGVMRAMLHTKLKRAVAIMVVLGTIAVSTGGLMSRTAATEPQSRTPDTRGPASADDLDRRVADLKRQVQQMQQKIADLEQAARVERRDAKCDTGFLADRFRYKVPFEIGYSETSEGGRLEIREVWGTRPKIEVGGQYLVKGKYVLPPGQRGKIYFYATASGAWGLVSTLDLQMTDADKGEGEFAVIHGMADDGWFHLVLADPDKYSRTFANVYFGTGDNVNRQKP